LAVPFVINCPLILELDLTGSVFPDLKILDDIAKGCPSLRQLNTDFTGFSGPLDELRIPATTFPSLEVLRIANASFSERDLVSIPRLCI
jgi:hypothetical protein